MMLLRHRPVVSFQEESDFFFNSKYLVVDSGYLLLGPLIRAAEYLTNDHIIINLTSFPADPTRSTDVDQIPQKTL